MCAEFATEAKMSDFHELDATGAGRSSGRSGKNRLPPGTAILVILGLSPFCWAGLIGIVIAIRAVL